MVLRWGRTCESSYSGEPAVCAAGGLSSTKIWEYEHVMFEVTNTYEEGNVVREVLRRIGGFLGPKYTDEMEKRQIEKTTHPQDI